MKTYILSTLNRYKQFSENSDVKSILCNKSWRLFNDSGEQELYIFQDNGTIFYSNNGKVLNGTWQYISANQSLIITIQSQSYMLHPEFKDTVILALKLDGTQNYLFMIDEKDSYSYKLKTLNDIESYFIEKERKIEENRRLIQQQTEIRRVEEQRQAEARRVEEQRQAEARRIEEQRQAEIRRIEEQRQAEIRQLRQEANDKLDRYRYIGKVCQILSVIGFIGLFIATTIAEIMNIGQDPIMMKFAMGLTIILSLGIFGCIYYYLVFEVKFVDNYIKKHAKRQ